VAAAAAKAEGAAAANASRPADAAKMAAP